MNMQFYKNLKRARVRMGKSQIEVAKAVGISNAALSNYETGYREPDLDTLCALSRYYGLTLDELLDVNGEQHEPIYDLSPCLLYTSRPYRVADFTSPAGLVIADAIKANYPQLIVKTDGGYEGAERIRIAFVDSDFNGTVDMVIRALKVNWDPRFRLLTHRDVLGSLMGLGIDRSKFGDVIVQQGGAQIMVCLLYTSLSYGSIFTFF